MRCTNSYAEWRRVRRSRGTGVKYEIHRNLMRRISLKAFHQCQWLRNVQTGVRASSNFENIFENIIMSNNQIESSITQRVWVLVDYLVCLSAYESSTYKRQKMKRRNTLK